MKLQVLVWQALSHIHVQLAVKGSVEFNVLPTAKVIWRHMETGPRLKDSFDRLEKPGIELATYRL